MVNKITWQRAGGVTEPGRYMFTFGWLTVTPDDLAVWESVSASRLHAGGAALASRRKNGEAAEVHGEEFHLGTFELPLPAGYEQLH